MCLESSVTTVNEKRFTSPQAYLFWSTGQSTYFTGDVGYLPLGGYEQNRKLSTWRSQY